MISRYRRLAFAIRRAAVRRGIVTLPPGHALRQPSARFWDDISWIALLAGVWVILSPWIWGYADAGGAIVTDVVTGALVIALALGAIVFPALWTLCLIAGLWLVLAPWIVGYGSAEGPVGISDSIAGVVILIVGIHSLSAAQRAVRPGAGAGAIGRIRPRAGGNDPTEKSSPR